MNSRFDQIVAHVSKVVLGKEEQIRLALTCLLAERSPRTQSELVQELGWPQSTVARHLALLRQRGLVTGRRQGAQVLLETGSLPRRLLDTVCESMGPTAAAAGPKRVVEET